ncbi:MAG: amino acid ABC transporter substrate-binding protein [Oceanospirillaceae bacterium]|jgi:polar amino acid transport system substrate-binding protein|uniref:ABC transporter substrate-binding protein n=1 Tax=Marinobacterium litorale TaxID=404770 RepID=UPI0003F610F3|nr:ABC transporter substrate-binding protein [Marinobacterium litorale]MBS97553.1 amino acid ABC transporter substrate-binding protein [Oceanospirillaceae bacterium]
MLKKMLMGACLGLALTTGAQAADGLDTVKSENEITFAMSGAYPPFNFVDEQGDLAGFDVEIGKEIAKRIGVEGTPIATAWDGIIAGLLANRYDTIIGSMAITDERLKTIDFSDPYYRSGAQLFVKKDSDIGDIQDMSGKKIGVTLGTTFEEWLRKNAPEVEIRTYKGVPQMMMETQSGRISGFVTDRLTGIMAIKDKGMNIQMAGDLLYPELIGIALQKENPELLAAINKAIADMQADGTYQQISEKWFGTDIR